VLKTYLYLTKPGIIMGNIITTAGGFFLASKGDISLWLFFITLIGLAFVIGSACVVNNYTDRDIDQKMERTKYRALVTGAISGKKALFFAAILGFTGLLILALGTNLLTAMVALIGFFIYVVLYAILKCRSIHGTLVGSLAGGIPPVVGYCAVSGRFDLAAFLLFTILVLWQMPHFFSIAVYRFQDYSAASIPVLPVKKGPRAAKIQMHFYIMAFLLAALSLTVFQFTGYANFLTATALGLMWLALCYQGINSKDDTIWAKKMFRFSLVVICVLFIALSLDVRDC
jgi:protoheme IX farnesyltransferase